MEWWWGGLQNGEKKGRGQSGDVCVTSSLMMLEKWKAFIPNPPPSNAKVHVGKQTWLLGHTDKADFRLSPPAPVRAELLERNEKRQKLKQFHILKVKFSLQMQE